MNDIHEYEDEKFYKNIKYINIIKIIHMQLQGSEKKVKI